MEPFDRKKAAEFFIVGWVKDWRMRTYLNAIGANKLNFEDIHKLYPWMPTDKNLHRLIKNSAIKPWTAYAMRAINDKLYDAKDNKERLALAKAVEHWDSTGAKDAFSHKEAIRERQNAAKQMRKTGLGYKASVETMRRGSGSHWNVVK